MKNCNRKWKGRFPGASKLLLYFIQYTDLLFYRYNKKKYFFLQNSEDL